MSDSQNIERCLAVVPCVSCEHPTFVGPAFIEEQANGQFRARIVRLGWSFMEPPYESIQIETNRPLLLMGSSIELLDFEPFHQLQDHGLARVITIRRLVKPLFDRFELNAPRENFEAWLFSPHVRCMIVPQGKDHALTMINAFEVIDDPDAGVAVFTSKELSERGEALVFSPALKATA